MRIKLLAGGMLMAIATPALAEDWDFVLVNKTGKTIKQIEAVPTPTQDEAMLTRWTGLLHTEQSYFQKIGEALGSGNKYRAQSLSVKLNRNSNLANNAILALDFEYCRIDPSRFS